MQGAMLALRMSSGVPAVVRQAHGWQCAFTLQSYGGRYNQLAERASSTPADKK